MVNSFKIEYSKLNKNQKIAVDTISGPVMVMAGPGTGKTQVLTLRIANILQKTDTQPSSILALTFTDAASNEMRERLVKLIGQPAYSVQISTFHAFCQSVILENPDLFIIAEETESLQDLDRTKILKDIILNNKLSYLKPLNAPFYYVLSIIGNIRSLKREGVNPKEFNEILEQRKQQLKADKDGLSKTVFNQREKDLLKNIDLQRIYSLYQQKILKQGRFDFEDMINWVTDKFEQDPNLLLSYQEKLSFFLVDEYQDTNSAQNQLVFLLTSFWKKKANLFAVGDANQSIFRFQGASLENTKEFVSRFPTTTLINLNQNYRSTENILSAAHAVIQNNSPRAIKLKSNLQSPGKPVSLVHFSNSVFEDHFLARDISNLIRKDIPLKDIAVIVRHNKDLEDLSIVLKKFSIPHTIQGGQDLLEKPLIKQLIILLTVIDQSPHNHLDTELFTLLNLNFFEIDSFHILRTAKQASDNRTHLASHVVSGKHKIPKDIKIFFDNLSKWQTDSANHSLPEFFEKLIQESGILNYLLKQKNKIDKLNQLNMFFTQIKNMALQDKDLNLSKFLKNVEALKEQSIKMVMSSPLSLSDSVTLTTTHKAKGLEWAHVYIYRCVNGKWGNPRIRQLIKLPPETLEFTAAEDSQKEERRIFYVAQTRAKKTLTITSASKYATNYGFQNTLPSTFVHELSKEATKEVDVQGLEKNSKEILEKVLAVQGPSSVSIKESEYLKKIIKDLKLSVTALTTFLDCSYKFKLNNLYRLPKAKEAYLVFGTAIHAALENFHQTFIKTNSIPTLEFLINQFRQALDKEVLKKEDYKVRLEHGTDVLTSYHKIQLKNIKPAHTLEKYFGYSSSPSGCQLGDISLIGKVDKIDVLNKEKKTAQIVDYKTGKPKTKGEIEGTTKTSTGYLKRQLVFYALLAKLDKNFPLKITNFQLDFIEQPYLKNKSGQMNFIISDREIKDLEVLIQQTMKEIRRLNFSKTKDSSNCQRCEFKTHCFPGGISKTI